MVRVLGAVPVDVRRFTVAQGNCAPHFWRQFGFPNLVLARAAKARKRQAQIRQEILEKARRFDPYVTLEESPRWAEILGMPYPYRLNKPRRGGY